MDPAANPCPTGHEFDLRFLIAVLNWASKSRDENGRLLLDSNPLRGLKTPKEKNPTRVVLSDEEYGALLGVSRRVDWRFHVALVLAHETGHRIGAIRQLRWADIDFEARTIVWRAEHEKTGYEHVTPMTDEAVVALEEAVQRKYPDSGHSPVLPAPRDTSRCAAYRRPGIGGTRPRRWRGSNRSAGGAGTR